MDFLKEAFQRVKEDVLSLRHDIGYLKMGMDDFQSSLSEVRESLLFLKEGLEDLVSLNKKIFSLYKELASTQTKIVSTNTADSSTHRQPFKPLEGQISSISIGNEGVTTDRQTHRQTDRHIENTLKTNDSLTKEPTYPNFTPPKDPIKNAAEILSSLDAIKKEIRLKFKRLTEREWLVFSTIYQQGEENGFSDYKEIASHLGLTESSIRDYVGRILSKGIPVEKHRINNKTIHLKISEDLKKVASLSTILQLRGL